MIARTRLRDSYVDARVSDGRCAIVMLAINATMVATILFASVVLSPFMLVVLLLMTMTGMFSTPLWFWRRRAYRHRVWLRDPDTLDDAIAFCAPLGWRCRHIEFAGRHAFTFFHQRDAVAFKLGWG